VNLQGCRTKRLCSKLKYYPVCWREWGKQKKICSQWSQYPELV